MVKEYVPKTDCYDCGLDYGSPAWVDVSISNEDWEKINPSEHKGGGLLCFNCMMVRFAKLGVKNLHIRGLFGDVICYECDCGCRKVSNGIN